MYKENESCAVEMKPRRLWKSDWTYCGLGAGMYFRAAEGNVGLMTAESRGLAQHWILSKILDRIFKSQLQRRWWV